MQLGSCGDKKNFLSLGGLSGEGGSETQRQSCMLKDRGGIVGH